MPAQIGEDVVAFYDSLFDQLFALPFGRLLDNPIKRREVLRRVQEASDAASQSLGRLFLNEKVTAPKIQSILKGLAKLDKVLTPADVATTTYSPDALLERFLPSVPPPKSLKSEAERTLYRVALHTVLQTLVLVGPVMSEWRSLGFSATYELPRRVVNRLNEISDRFTGHSGVAQDYAYEETYRDYLVSRFHQTGVGTVKMTTQMAVDVRELFVMPRTTVTSPSHESESAGEFLELAKAREFLTKAAHTSKQGEPAGIPALQQVRETQRNVLIGLPGSGKSTFLDWLQVQLAFVQEELVMAGEQAIPLLLRLRELDPEHLPRVSDLLRFALASLDRAALAPPKWLERQLRAGRVFLMLDGVDEIEPDHRDKYLLPWVATLCKEYPKCRYLISSRPVGYPPNALTELDFTVCRLLDFDKEQVADYAKHWCTAIRLAQNEGEEEARREGATEGSVIVRSFEGNPYVRDLARNPLMLSAVCLVNYFERGKLPEDRAILYSMCVDGLLHNWDQRRGIRSEFALEEKLRVCRELAIRMQTENRAEFEATKVFDVFAAVLRDEGRARKLLENIRYRTGLLIERRNGVYAFAHLTFQEYLAAQGIARGNSMGINFNQIMHDHDGGRWHEVIALYCAIVDSSENRRAIAELITQVDFDPSAKVLTEAFFTSGEEITTDAALRKQVVSRVAAAPSGSFGVNPLDRFDLLEAAKAANKTIGRIGPPDNLTCAFNFLRDNNQHIREASMKAGLLKTRTRSTMRLTELMFLAHRSGSDKLLGELALMSQLYSAKGPTFDVITYGTQAEVAFIAFPERVSKGPGYRAAFNTTLDALLAAKRLPSVLALGNTVPVIPSDPTARAKLIRIVERVAKSERREFVVSWLESLRNYPRETAPPRTEKPGNKDK